MKYSCFMSIMLVCVAIATDGCSRAESESENQGTDATNPNNSSQANSSDTSQSAKDGWKMYTPPEKDFSVMAPADVKASTNETKVGKWREYRFQKGEAYITVKIHTDRKEPLTGNTVEEFKSDTSDYLPNSLKDITLGDMAGVEFRMKGAIGESIFREYCASDSSRTISIQIAKDFEGGFGEDEIRLFLDSFKLLK